MWNRFRIFNKLLCCCIYMRWEEQQQQGEIRTRWKKNIHLVAIWKVQGYRSRGTEKEEEKRHFDDFMSAFFKAKLDKKKELNDR